MYTLSTGLWEKFLKKKDYFVVIVGLDNAGKTVVLNNTCLNFWDLGGQEDLRSLWSNYFDEAHAMIFVVDASRRDLFTTVSNVFKDVLESEFVQQMPVLVAVNKSELEDAAPAAEPRVGHLVGGGQHITGECGNMRVDHAVGQLLVQYTSSGVHKKCEARFLLGHGKPRSGPYYMTINT